MAHPESPVCYFCVFGKSREGDDFDRSSPYAPPRPIMECTVLESANEEDTHLEILHHGHMVELHKLLPGQHEDLLRNKTPQSPCLVYRRTSSGAKTRAFRAR